MVLKNFNPIIKTVKDVGNLVPITAPESDSKGKILYTSSNDTVGQIVSKINKFNNDLIYNDSYIPYSMTLSSDGSTLVVGKNIKIGNDIVETVIVYKLVNGQWSSSIQKFDEYYTNKSFGYSVSVSADGNTLAIGAPTNLEFNKEFGCVKIYKWDSINNYWVRKGSDLIGIKDDNNQYILDQSPYVGEKFGKSIALTSDGNTIVVGAPEYLNNGVKRGRVVVYQWSSTKNNNYNWIKKGDSIINSLTGNFGYSVCINSDGTQIGFLDNSFSYIYNYIGSKWEYKFSTIGRKILFNLTGKLFLVIYSSTHMLGFNIINKDIIDIYQESTNRSNFQSIKTIESSNPINNIVFSSDSKTIVFGTKSSDNSTNIKIYKLFGDFGAQWYQYGSDIIGDNSDFGNLLATDAVSNNFITNTKSNQISTYLNDIKEWSVKIIGKGESTITAVQDKYEDKVESKIFLSSTIDTKLTVNSYSALDAALDHNGLDKGKILEAAAEQAMATAAADAADAATKAAQEAVDAVNALNTGVANLTKALKQQITSMIALVLKIQKRVKA